MWTSFRGAPQKPCPDGYNLVESYDVTLSDGASATVNKCLGPGGDLKTTWTNITLPPVVVTACQYCGPAGDGIGIRTYGPNPLLIGLAKGGMQYFPMDDDLVRGITKASSAQDIQAAINRVDGALNSGQLPKERARALRGWRKVARGQWVPNALKRGAGPASILLWLFFPQPLGSQCVPGVPCN